MILLKIIAVVLPWPLKRWFLEKLFGYKLHKKARIGLAWCFPKMLIMEEGARIAPLNVAGHLDSMELNDYATIARGNWITGFPSQTDSPHFQHQKERTSCLLMKQHSAITKNHHIDCTHQVTIGQFTTIAGYRSQLLTHSIDIHSGRQTSAPIEIGDYCFVGTASVILGGATLPNYSVLGAMSLLNKTFEQSYTLYAGVPAKRVKSINENAKYFTRTEGFIN